MSSLVHLQESYNWNLQRVIANFQRKFTNSKQIVGLTRLVWSVIRFVYFWERLIDPTDWFSFLPLLIIVTVSSSWFKAKFMFYTMPLHGCVVNQRDSYVKLIQQSSKAPKIQPTSPGKTHTTISFPICTTNWVILARTFTWKAYIANNILQWNFCRVPFAVLTL